MRTALITFFVFLFYLSLWGQNNPPTAVDDYVVTFRGYAEFNPLENDYDIDGDSVRLFMLGAGKYGRLIKDGDLVNYIAYHTCQGGNDTVKYYIKDFGSPPKIDTGKIIVIVDNPLSFDTVDVNNIKTGVNADGFLFCTKYKYSANTNYQYTPMFNIPNIETNKKHTIFSGNLWIGGIDENDSLHLAAQMYYGNGFDYWPGPVANNYDSIYDYKYKRLWKVTKQDIDYHLAHYLLPAYTPSQNLLDWPANGNVQNGESAVIAPFFDNNNDGIYNPYDGDYPIIRGDASVLFIFNDDRYPHTETKGKKMGVEIISMLYAFDCPEDSALWNTVFLYFKIVNKSDLTYRNTYAGLYVDTELGYAFDDYIACDVQRGSMYTFNGMDIDGNGQDYAYGSFPPAQSVTFLGGPYIDPDGWDNANDNCDEGVNGLNFGNGIVDDERHGLSIGGTFFGIGGYYGMTVPYLAPDYYNYLHGYWKDSIQKHYWGNGHPISGGTGPPCRFTFSDTSDLCNWGTWGIDPGGTEPWTEKQASNPPYDRRLYGSSGPFTFLPGASHELDLAFVFGRNFTDPDAKAAITVMKQRIDSVRSYFIKDKTPCSNKFSAYKPEVPNQDFIYIYPNPTSGELTVEYSSETYQRYEIFDVLGKLIKSGDLTENRKQVIDISILKKGLYLIRVRGERNTITRKVIKT